MTETPQGPERQRTTETPGVNTQDMETNEGSEIKCCNNKGGEWLKAFLDNVHSERFNNIMWGRLIGAHVNDMPAADGIQFRHNVENLCYCALSDGYQEGKRADKFEDFTMSYCRT